MSIALVNVININVIVNIIDMTLVNHLGSTFNIAAVGSLVGNTRKRSVDDIRDIHEIHDITFISYYYYPYYCIYIQAKLAPIM